jgi:hypothetical protein
MEAVREMYSVNITYDEIYGCYLCFTSYVEKYGKRLSEKNLETM